MTGSTNGFISNNQWAAPARPFLKWAGGKTQLLSQLAVHYPAGLYDGSVNRYVEPFLGGGAVFLDVVQRFPIEEAFLFDVNRELILAYRVVKEAPDALIARLKKLQADFYDRSGEARQTLYYSTRQAYNRQRFHLDYDRFNDAWIERAALMLFLNRTCYNGLYRVNSKGGFNVPFGRYKRPKIVDPANILRVSSLLTNVQLGVADFEACRRHVNHRTFVYFDPPYRPLTQTASFTAYSTVTFDDEAQRRLARFYTQLARRTGARLMLSNSDPRNADPDDAFFDTLYAPFHIHRVLANRMINSAAGSRGKITELLITTHTGQPELPFPDYATAVAA